MTTLLRILLLALTALLTVVPAEATPAELAITPDLLCRVHRAIRQPVAWWTEAECLRIAEAFNATTEPAPLQANCMLESDWRQSGLRKVNATVFDAGLCGIRCVLGEDGRCTNGPAAGHTLAELLDPVVNITVAGRLWATKRAACGTRAPACWKGLLDDHGKRAAEIAAVIGAQRGRSPTDPKIARGLAAKIARAMRPANGPKARKS